MQDARLGVARGTALYIGALIGPGVLLVPSLAAQAAGPAAILAWVALLILSVPLAVTFATLGVRHPVAGGVTAYVREGFGERAAAVTGTVFLTAVVLGAPAVSLIGGFYVVELVGGGLEVAVGAAVAMFGAVLGANAFGLRVSAGVQLALSSMLVAIIVLGIGIGLPGRVGDHWTPFAPHGWWAVGTAASLLAWLFFGWEAMAQLAGDFRDPRRDLPRAITLAFMVIAVLYVGLAVATIAVTAGHGSRVPLADLLGVGLGPAGRQGTAILAVALTMGTMNVYMAGSAKLAVALAADAALPGWLASGTPRSVPLRPLAAIAGVGVGILALLAAGTVQATDLVRATSACFISVYVLALSSAVRIIAGRARAVAAVALALVLAVTVFSAAFLLVPFAVAVLTLITKRPLTTRRAGKPATAP